MAAISSDDDEEIVKRYAYQFTKFASNYAAHAYCPNYNRLNGDGVDLEEACDTVFCHSRQGVKLLHVHKNRITYIILDDVPNKRLIISFKGTSTNQEWQLDANYRLKRYVPLVVLNRRNRKDFKCYHCKAHRGFLKGYAEFYEDSGKEVLDFLDEHSDYTVLLTGHSLGGALAQVAAIELYLCGHKPILINFGSPKLTNCELADWMNKHFPPELAYDSLREGELKPNCYLRVTHDNDLVPMLPPYNQGFSHSGYGISIENFNIPVLFEDLDLSGEFDRWNERSAWKVKLKHFTKNYKKYMKDPMSGYRDFLQIDYHRYYYSRMTCSYKRMPKVSVNEEEDTDTERND